MPQKWTEWKGVCQCIFKAIVKACTVRPHFVKKKKLYKGTCLQRRKVGRIYIKVLMVTSGKVGILVFLLLFFFL